MNKAIRKLQQPADKKPLDPHKTICVCKHDGKEVGRIPATAPNAPDYIQELMLLYGSLQVEYEEDTTGGLMAMIHGRR